MSPKHEPDLEELFHRELRNLPPWKAPPSLAPRIMAQVRAKALAAEAPWWLQSWSAWPLYARAALFIAAILIASLFFSGSIVLDDQVRTMAAPSWFANIVDEFATFGNTIALLWQKVGQPLFLTRLVVCLVMYFLCLGLGTAMFRVVRRESFQ
jgi:hypothetical protein